MRWAREEGTEEALDDRPASSHDVVSRSGDELHFGQRPPDNDMCTPEKRPTSLSATALAKR